MTKKFEIEKLQHRGLDYSSAQCAVYGEACIVALEHQSHCSGVTMRIEGTISDSYCLEWYTKPNKNGHLAKRKRAENAATAVAFFLIAERTEYSAFLESEILQGDDTTGIDYWLSYSEDHSLYDEDNFMRARLEISGINKGSANRIQRRLEKKIEQAGTSDDTGTPVYVVVAEFGTPIAMLFERL